MSGFERDLTLEFSGAEMASAGTTCYVFCAHTPTANEWMNFCVSNVDSLLKFLLIK